MQCSLIKRVTTKVTDDGKTKRFYNYQLVFPNGQKVDICAKYISTENVKDEIKKEQISKTNMRNALTLDILSDEESDDKDA